MGALRLTNTKAETRHPMTIGKLIGSFQVM